MVNPIHSDTIKRRCLIKIVRDIHHYLIKSCLFSFQLRFKFTWVRIKVNINLYKTLIKFKYDTYDVVTTDMSSGLDLEGRFT